MLDCLYRKNKVLCCKYLFTNDLHNMHRSKTDHSRCPVKNIFKLRLSLIQEWYSPTMILVGKFACIELTISSCYGSGSVPYGDWERAL